MPDVSYLDQLANKIYHETMIAPSSVTLARTGPVGPVETLPSTEISSRPHSQHESGLEPVSQYYFLSNALPRNPVKVPDHSPGSPLDLRSIRKNFPILGQQVNGNPLIWLDNAATTQKPECVIDSIRRYYREYNSNVHRGSHSLANRATDAYENARQKAGKLIGASATDQIVFVRGTTEAINLIAQTYGRMMLRRGDQILLSTMEHHSNIIPWQLLGQETGAIIRVIPLNDRGMLKLDEYEKMLTYRPRIVAFTHVSNVLGTINPVRQMIEMAHYYGARVLIDGAQAVPHFPVSVQELDADFYAFSGHKIYGPTGIGVLYGKRSLLEEMPPWQGGGSMIKEVSFEHTTYNKLPHKFEAGTGNIAAAIGLGAAVDYLQHIGLAYIESHERELTSYAGEELARIPGLRIIGTAPQKISVISFVVDNISPETLAHRLDQAGIAVRVGHHCAQPLLRHYGLTDTLRVSLGLYNTKKEINRLVEVILKAIR